MVVEGVEANAFQYMTGGTALVIGTTGANLGSGMTGGTVYLHSYDPWSLNRDYVKAEPIGEDEPLVRKLLEEHVAETGSPKAKCLLANFNADDFVKVTTCVIPEPVDE